MRAPARLIAAALLCAMVAAAATAQSDERGSAGEPAGTDTLGVSTLEEQLIAPGDEDDIDRERESTGESARSGGWRLRWRLRLSSALQPSAAYLSGYYAGSRPKIYQRFEVREGKTLRISLLTEKDPGERRLVDFISGALSAGGLPGGTSLVAGDFRIRAGQGLLFGAGRSFGKGSAVIEPVIREAWGIPAGLSSDEVDFFRGAAISAGAGPVSGILFGSVRSLSPVVSPDGRLRGIDRSGYHRTATELGRAGRLTERSAGGLLHFSAGGTLLAGLSVLRSSIEPRWSDGEGSPPRYPVRVRASADFRVRAGPATIFGEAVFSAPRPPWIAGLLITSPGGMRALVVRRSYPASAEIDRTFGFGDGSAGRNEAGFYVAVESPVAPGLNASGYLDLFSSPSPPSRALLPPAGMDRSLSLRAVAPGFGFDAVYRSRITEEKGPAATGEGPATPGNRTRRSDRMKCIVRWDAGGGVSCRIRFERSIVSPGVRRATDRGLMGSAEVTARPARGMTVQARLELFGAPSDVSGFTSVEADLPGTLSATALSGDGSNWYLLWSWQLSRQLGVSLKYSRFRRDDIRKIGTGAGELPSNIREKAGAQLDLRW